MKRNRNFYMHTMDGKPAFFDGDQICFYSHYAREQRVCDSLGQIRREQKATRDFREAHGWDDLSRYGYVRFRLPIPASKQEHPHDND